MTPTHNQSASNGHRSSSDPLHVVVIGAGVSGLTSALTILRTIPSSSVTIVAKWVPGDLNAREYASPWAGANWLSWATSSTSDAKADKLTWEMFNELALTKPECGVHFQDLVQVWNADSIEEGTSEWMKELLRPEGPWFQDLLPNFRILNSDDAAKYGRTNGLAFTSIILNPQIYLPWLVSQLLKFGPKRFKMIRTHLPSLQDAASWHHLGKPADVVINCPGIGAKTLAGVEDETMYPIRGQIVVVSEESNNTQYADLAIDAEAPTGEVCYIFQRMGGGTVLGGTYQPDNDSAVPDPATTKRIIKRALHLAPELKISQRNNFDNSGPLNEGPTVLFEYVGFRPARKGGVRVGRELIELSDGTTLPVIHNYGHGGYGYQSSWGYATRVVKLIKEEFDGSVGEVVFEEVASALKAFVE